MVRKVVLNGKAKFGAGGAGKEVPQVVMARSFRPGDYLCGYYRDQTFLLAKKLLQTEDFFAFLYGDCDNESHSGGRQMPNGFATAMIDPFGNDLDHRQRFNVSSVISSVAAQAPRAVGLALASKIYRAQGSDNHFTSKGQEVCFCTIGDASTSEGAFFEAVNAAGVLQIPLAIFIWDDGYGISVPTRYQTTKESISEILRGFQPDSAGAGVDIYAIKAWDYPALRSTITKGIHKVRSTCTPAIFHIEECTQPYGHSTSGSHERYKSVERLQWEQDMDGIRKMREWILTNEIASREELEALEVAAKKEVKNGNKKAWTRFRAPIEDLRKSLRHIYTAIDHASISSVTKELDDFKYPVTSHLLAHARDTAFALNEASDANLHGLKQWIEQTESLLGDRYHPHLYSENKHSALRVTPVPVQYEPDAPLVNGYEILNAFFDHMLEKYPNTYAFGEDVGKIGDVNQGFSGLQEKYGESRVFDTGIREWTIVGQAIGMAQRGLRPIAEIQYLDYLAYAFAPLTDDLATLRYRTNGSQRAPVIIRTRGHRLEGIWHSGSPIGMLLHSMRGIHILVPRNMTQAAGMYQTLLQSDDSAILIECLNGYRIKERLPSNLSEFCVALGEPEILSAGHHITLVTYGSCVQIAQEALVRLANKNIRVELIDVQTLLPFDLNHMIVKSLQKTNRIAFLDEDVPGGATAYMMQLVLEEQNGYQYLDAPPLSITARAHRPAFGDDGNYVSKPNVEDVTTALFDLVRQ